MTPKEKAIKLIDKYMSITDINYNHKTNLLNPDEAKQCALIAADEILSVIPMYTGNLNPKWEYWNDVKTELEKL